MTGQNSTNGLPNNKGKQKIGEMKNYMVTYLVQFEDGLREHTVMAKNCKDEHDAELKVMHYWIEDRNLPIGRCTKVSTVS
jgi:hypothetical protein